MFMYLQHYGIDLEDILSKRNQRKTNPVWFHLYVKSQNKANEQIDNNTELQMQRTSKWLPERKRRAGERGMQWETKSYKPQLEINESWTKEGTNVQMQSTMWYLGNKITIWDLLYDYFKSARNINPYVVSHNIYRSLIKVKEQSKVRSHL